MLTSPKRCGTLKIFTRDIYTQWWQDTEENMRNWRTSLSVFSFFFLAICKALLSYHSSPLLYNASSRGWGRHWGGDQPEAVIWLLKLVCCRAGVVKHYGLEKPLPTSPKIKLLSPPLLTWYTIGIMIIVHDNIIAYCCFRSNFRAWHA